MTEAIKEHFSLMAKAEKAVGGNGINTSSNATIATTTSSSSRVNPVVRFDVTAARRGRYSGSTPGSRQYVR